MEMWFQQFSKVTISSYTVPLLFNSRKLFIILLINTSLYFNVHLNSCNSLFLPYIYSNKGMDNLYNYGVQKYNLKEVTKVAYSCMCKDREWLHMAMCPLQSCHRMLNDTLGFLSARRPY